MSILARSLVPAIAVAALLLASACEWRGVSGGPHRHPHRSTARARTAAPKGPVAQIKKDPAPAEKTPGSGRPNPGPAKPSPTAGQRPVAKAPPPPTPTASDRLPAAGASAPAPRPPAPPPPAARRLPPVDLRPLQVPASQLPAPGECRVWIPGRPSGEQPEPGACSELRHELPAGAWLLHRPASQPDRVRVSVSDSRRPGLVVVIRLYEAESGRFLKEELP